MAKAEELFGDEILFIPDSDIKRVTKIVIGRDL